MNISDLNTLFLNMPAVVSPESFKEMSALHKLEFSHPDIQPSYGLGLMGDTGSAFGPVFGHNGGGPGFSIAAYVVPEKGISISAVIDHDSSVEAEKLVFEVLKKVPGTFLRLH